MLFYLIQTFSYFLIAASVADAAAANPNGIKVLLANGLSTFPIKCSPVFSNGPKNLPKTTEFLIILCLLMNHLRKLYEALELVY